MLVQLLLQKRVARFYSYNSLAFSGEYWNRTDDLLTARENDPLLPN